MKNINRLAASICNNNGNNILIHTIPNTNNWLICQKIEPDKWLFTLSNPKGNITYNLGTTQNQSHFPLWTQLTQESFNIPKCSQFNLAQTFIKRITKLNKDINSSGFILKNFLNNDTIKLKVPNTKFWILAEQKPTKLWDIWIYDPKKEKREILRQNQTTQALTEFSTVVLKQPYNFSEQERKNISTMKYYINNVIKSSKT